MMNAHFKFLFATTLILLFYLAPLGAQCPLTVNAGPDQVVCNAGGTATLSGSITGNALGFSWSPPMGLSDPNDLTPTATVTGPMTYTLTAQAFDPNAPNLVSNGDFEAGNTGFSSDYAYNPVPVTPGTYVLTTSPSLVLSNFPPCDDHTYGNGTGYMMLVNGAGSPGADIWCQTIPVVPGSFYTMSAWVASSPLFPPQLQFYVNNSPVGNVFNSSGSGCVWEQFSANWDAGSASSATVCIVTQNSGNGLFGDDYALDDISFAAACSVSDEVSVSLATVDAVLPLTAILPCSAAQTGIVLDGSASTSGPFISYQWTTSDGNILSGANTPSATVNAPGNYSLSVAFDNGATLCEDFAFITVLPDPNIAFAAIAQPGNLDCNNPVLSLDAGASSSGPGIAYSWSYLPGPGGVPPGIVAGGNTPFPDVNQPGTYALTVTNSASGCTATEFVTVEADFAQPTAVAASPGNLSCTVSTITLSGNGSSTGGNFSYLWETSNGHIVSGENTLNNCTIDEAGAYTLTVTNNQNGCSATSVVGVSGSSGTTPTAVASAPSMIDCETSSVQLSGTGSSTGTGIVYAWSSTLGVIDSGGTTLTPWVSQAAVYTLIVTDTASACSDTASVTLLADTTAPTASIAPAGMLTCTTVSLFLDANSSSSGPDFSYLWSSADGQILQGETSLSPEIGAAGTYSLAVTDNSNGCTATASVTVSQDGNLPQVNISASGNLDCLNNSVTLDASTSSTGANILFTWTTADGHFVSGQNSLMPTVDAAGIYTLTLVDQNNNCSATGSITVSQNNTAFNVEILPAGPLTCQDSSLQLSASSSGTGSMLQYLWATTDGLILNGGSTLSPTIGAPGWYVFTATNQQNGCSATDSLLVGIDTLPPFADAGPPASLTCDQTSVLLDGSASSQGSLFAYHWTFSPAAPSSPAGILVGETSLSPAVNGEGNYLLTVTNLQNGCTAIDSVEVEVSADFPIVEIAPVNALTCAVTSLTLNANASLGSNYVYQWSSADGNIVSGANSLSPTVDAPGTYQLTVADTQNGCTSSDLVVLGENLTPPMAEAGAGFQLSCSITNAQLDGSGSSLGSQYFYVWTTANGNILSGSNSLAPSINAAGTYTLLVTDNSNGCTATDEVSISQDANAPVANAGPALYLTCLAGQVLLDGSGSSAGPAITFQWSSTDGNILTGGNSTSPLVDAPGTYLLTVSNLSNNCQSLSSVQVIDFTQSPSADAGAPVELSCTDSILQLNGSASGGNLLEYAWAAQGGNILSGASTAQPMVDAPGTYTLLVTNLENGCTGTASVQVGNDTAPPTIQLGAAGVLTCAVNSLSLSANGTSTGPDFSYLWTTSNGQIVSGETGLSPVVDQPGDYTLTVLNIENGCTAQASLLVSQDTLPPVALIQAPQAFDCNTSQITLDGTGSSTGPGFAYQWSTTDGNITGGANSLLAAIDAAGTYQLQVTNLANACTAIATVVLASNNTAPVAEIAPPAGLNCLLEQTSLNAGNSSQGPDFSIAWATPNGQFISGSNTLSPVVGTAGTYTLTITNLQNGCSATASVVVVENMDMPGAEAGADMVLNCNETVVALAGYSPNTGVEFTWQSPDGHFLSGQNTPMPVVDSAGLYFLTVTDPANGCTGTDSVRVSRVVPEGFSIEKTAPGCLAGTGSLHFTQIQNGTPPFEYSIDGGATFSQVGLFENLPAGLYELTVEDAGGCSLTQTVELAAAQGIVIQLEAEVELGLGETYPLRPQLSIPDSDVAQVLWTPASQLSCSDCLYPNLEAVVDTTYRLEISDFNGCTATASIVVRVVTGQGIYVPNAFSPNGDGINDYLTVFARPGLVKEVLGLQVFSRWGESVFSQHHFPPNELNIGWDGTHRGKKLDSGIYVWWAEVELANGERRVLEGEILLFR